MMRWIVGSSVKAARVVVAVAVVIMAVGVWQLRNAETDALPEFAPPTVEVQTEALGLSAEEVEQLITVPLEQDLLDGVAWLDTIESKSVPGLSSVRMVFEPGTDVYRARQVVQERISQAAGLPNVSRPPQMLQPQSSTSRAVMVSLASKTLTPIEIGVQARWTIRPRLLAVPGVASVAIWGQRERQLQVQVDPEKLAEKNVTLEQVISSTGNGLWVSPLTFLEASSPGTGGFIDTPNQRLGIQHNLPVITPDDLGRIAIDETGDDALTLSDIATVVEDHQPLIGDAVVTGPGAGQAGFMLVIEKLPNANTATVTEGVDEALKELAPGLRGLQIDPTVFRPASYVAESEHDVTRAMVIGAVLLALGLLLFLFSWRAALVGIFAVVLSFTVAATVLNLFDQTFTTVIFAGLVLALVAVVDDAIGNVDAMSRRLRARDHEADVPARMDLVRTAALGAGRSTLWATVAFALALTPIFLMNGLSGDSFFPPVAGACLVALVVSMLVALTVTPALGLLILSDRSVRRESPVTRALEHGYHRSLGPILRTPVPAIAFAGAVVIAAAVVLPGFEKALLPHLRDTNVMVNWDAPFGTSLNEMDRITARAAAEIRAIPGVRNVAGQVGQAVHGDQPVGSDSAQMWVRLDPDAAYDSTVDAVKRVVAGYPGMRHEVLTYSDEKMRETLGRTSDEVTVRIFGDNLDTLHEKGDEVRNLMTQIDGVDSARVTTRSSEPTMAVQVDLAKAQAAGIKPGDVRRAAAVLLSGLRAGSLFEKQKVFDVVVWSNPTSRHSLSSVKSLLIDTPNGGHVRLGDVADVQVRATVPSIEHQDVSRFVDVAANVSGRSPDAVAGQLRDRLEGVDFPFEYHAEILGDYNDQQDAQRRLLGLAIAAAIGVFLILQAAFTSWRTALVAFLALPVALTGGVLAARIDGDVMTLATVAGLLAVLVIALRTNVTLIDRLHTLRLGETELGPDVVARAARERAAPTVMTAALTMLVLAPALVMGNVAGLELVAPMGFVILGGLITSTITSLYVVPALYLRFGPRQLPQPLDLEVEFERAEEAAKARARTDGEPPTLSDSVGVGDG